MLPTRTKRVFQVSRKAILRQKKVLRRPVKSWPFDCYQTPFPPSSLCSSNNWWGFGFLVLGRSLESFHGTHGLFSFSSLTFSGAAGVCQGEFPVCRRSICKYAVPSNWTCPKDRITLPWIFRKSLDATRRGSSEPQIWWDDWLLTALHFHRPFAHLPSSPRQQLWYRELWMLPQLVWKTNFILVGASRALLQDSAFRHLRRFLFSGVITFTIPLPSSSVHQRRLFHLEINFESQSSCRERVKRRCTSLQKKRRPSRTVLQTDVENPSSEIGFASLKSFASSLKGNLEEKSTFGSRRDFELSNRGCTQRLPHEHFPPSHFHFSFDQGCGMFGGISSVLPLKV